MVESLEMWIIFRIFIGWQGGSREWGGLRKINEKRFGILRNISDLYGVIKEIDMREPHIKSSWLSNGTMMYLVLFPSGVERVMSRERFVGFQKDGWYILQMP